MFTTQTKKYSFGFCGVFRSSIKKKKNIRPRIDIYTTDSEYVILSKLMDAFLTRDCDVHFEFGEYNFANIYTEMYDTIPKAEDILRNAYTIGATPVEQEKLIIARVTQDGVTWY